ncbi:MAG: DUF4175 family protein [Opitutales bacterium]|nr:DUF4175 family protein [Opitutales bacterium]
MKPFFIQQLEPYRRLITRRRLIACTLLSALAFLVAIVAIDGFTRFTGIREHTALWVVGILILSGISGGVTAMVLTWRSRPQLRDLAARIEDRHPELFDTLNTAVEIAETRNGPSNLLEASLFHQVDNSLRDIPLRQSLLPSWLRLPSLLAMGICLFLLFGWSLMVPLNQKAFYAFQDWQLGSHSGLFIKPEELSIARGSDLTVSVDIRRWEMDAKIAFRSPGAELERHPMTAGRDGLRRFSFYAVDEAIQFRIETPSLRSEWKTIQPFTPPRIEDLSIEVQPPAYTRIEPSQREGLGTLRVPEGSEIHFQLSTRETESAQLKAGDNAFEFDPTDGERESSDAETVPVEDWQLRYRAENSLRYYLRLSNANTFIETDSYRLEVLPDEPPVVEILEPGEDIQIEPDNNLHLVIYAADDYGLSALTIQLSIGGRDRESIPIRPRSEHEDGRPPLEVRIPAAIDFRSLDVEDGDLVSYWVQVSDNREPDPQHARSEVYFVEVREEVDPEEVDGMPDDSERLNLRASIEELKRLIRLSHRAISRSGEERLSRNQEVASGLLNLRREVQEVYDEILPSLEEQGDQFFRRGFDSVIGLLRSAERLVTEDYTESSINSQEQALQELIAMENALQQTEISRQPSEGEDGEEGAEPSEGEGEPGDMSELDRLRELLAELEETGSRQNVQNNQVDRAGRVGADAEELSDLAENQEGLRQGLRSIERELERLPETEDVLVHLYDASRRMRGAGDALREAESTRAWRDGLRASDGLENAIRRLQDRLDDAAGHALDALQRETQRLAERQRQGAEGSREALEQGSDPDPLFDEQQDLNTDFDSLLERMEALARELGEFFPEVSRSLSQAARQARDQEPGSSLSRAANALLYEQLEQALELQEEAADGLEGLASRIGESGAELPALNERQLERLLSELNRDRSTLESMDPSEVEEDPSQLDGIRREWADRLEPLAESLGDDRMDSLARGLRSESGTPSSRLRDGLHLFDEVERQLEGYRQQLQRRQALQLRRRSAPPPESYREQVESYFRRLAEEDDE